MGQISIPFSSPPAGLVSGCFCRDRSAESCRRAKPSRTAQGQCGGYPAHDPGSFWECVSFSHKRCTSFQWLLPWWPRNGCQLPWFPDKSARPRDEGEREKVVLQWKTNIRNHTDTQTRLLVGSLRNKGQDWWTWKWKHVAGGQMGFLGVLQKVAVECRVVKTFDSALRASRSEFGRFWPWGPKGRDKFNLGFTPIASSNQTRI